MTQTTAETLLKAKALISNPANWNQTGVYRSQNDTEAGCMCILSSVAAVVGCEPEHACATVAGTALIDFALSEFGLTIFEYNDAETTSHDDIMNVFDRTIEILNDHG